MMQPYRNSSNTRFAGTELLGAINRANQSTGADLGSMAALAAGDIKSQRDISNAQTKLVKAQAYAGQTPSTGGGLSGLFGAATSIAGGLFGGGGGSNPFGNFGSAAKLGFTMPSYMSGAGNFGSFWGG